MDRGAQGRGHHRDTRRSSHISEACERYRLSHEELSAWEAAFDEDGIAGLQKKYRSIRAENRAQS
jgi:hypothetical protein